MTIINLKELYPGLYPVDVYCEVSDAVAAVIKQSLRDNHAYYERRRKHRAYFSLDTLPESEILFLIPSPETIVENTAYKQALYSAMRQLPPKQASRLYAHFFLELSYMQIARIEGVHHTTVSRSISQAIKNLKKLLER